VHALHDGNAIEHGPGCPVPLGQHQHVVPRPWSGSSRR
jgi:hypothetical protein